MPTTTIKCQNWEEFELRLAEIRCEQEARQRSTDFLFRGLGDSKWPLDTTLERVGHAGTAVSEYFKVMCRAKPSIETLTSARWALPEYPTVESDLATPDGWNLRRFPDQETYGYMIHLRHHGFPSPLLDWTRSVYIAAFFAFRTAITAADQASICAFSESPAHYHSDSLGEPQVRSIGRFVTTHRRHFLQQSDYTMAVVFHEQWRFAKHDDVFNRADPNQDVLWKFNIPQSERMKVLRLLDSYNLNAFSLFGSEESLMETLAARELRL